MKVRWTITSGSDDISKLVDESFALVGGVDHPPSGYLEPLETLNEMGCTNHTLVVKRLQVTRSNYTLSINRSRLSKDRSRSTTHGTGGVTDVPCAEACPMKRMVTTRFACFTIVKRDIANRALHLDCDGFTHMGVVPGPDSTRVFHECLYTSST